VNSTNKKTIHPGATIAGLLHDHLIRSGLSETEAGQYLGVDQSQVGRWRRGVTVVRATNLPALAEFLGVDAVELEAARVESERVRADVAARKAGNSPEDDFAKMKADLKASAARIKRLERQLIEALAASKNA
jgi:transcriptional regulator with XRE-family HTH domain